VAFITHSDVLLDMAEYVTAGLLLDGESNPPPSPPGKWQGLPRHGDTFWLIVTYTSKVIPLFYGIDKSGMYYYCECG